MPATTVFSEADKKRIKGHLQELCRNYWLTKGYKKTNIKELCRDAKISVGSFYSLYAAKEDLFLATVNDIQRRLEEQVIAIVQEAPTREGFALAIKALVREYDKIPFLYDANTEDFLSFVTKLSDETMEKLKSDRMEFLRKLIRATNLKLKVSEQEAYGVLSALLATVLAKETISLTCDYFMVYDFMVDGLMVSIFEEIISL